MRQLIPDILQIVIHHVSLSVFDLYCLVVMRLRDMRAIDGYLTLVEFTLRELEKLLHDISWILSKTVVHKLVCNVLFGVLDPRCCLLGVVEVHVHVVEVSITRRKSVAL